MPASNLTNLQVFQRTLEIANTQIIAQYVNAFNAASRGGIVLRGGNNPGDYNRETLYNLLDAVQLRDINVDDDQTSIALARSVIGGVKVGYGTKPIRMDEALQNWIGRAPGEAGVVTAQQLAPAFLAQKLNVSIGAAVAALGTIGATVVNDILAATMSLPALVDTAGLFGDRAQAVTCWVMHSHVHTQLVKANLAQAAAFLFTFGTVNIGQDVSGRTFVVTDSPDLIAEDGDYFTLGLVPGGIVIEENPGFRTNMDTRNGGTSIRDTWQAEGTFNLTLKGLKWDEANGGPSPLSDALIMGTNWDQIVTSIKDGMGVMVRSAAA
jgi:hypothetical protein